MPRFIHSPDRDPKSSRRDEDQQQPESGGGDDGEGPERDDRDDPDRENGRARRRETKPAKFSGAQAVKYARQYIAELTGQVPESVSGLTRSDGGWKVTLDVVELERVPRTTDVLASYEAELDEQGELVGYRRVGRYYRNQVDER